MALGGGGFENPGLGRGIGGGGGIEKLGGGGTGKLGIGSGIGLIGPDVVGNMVKEVE